ncbi:MAG: hypothetical protein IPL54_07370 [Chitinophagaceae bacterium]|nr:hypothetical protein [Chitinophagaceae bacterium]
MKQPFIIGILLVAAHCVSAQVTKRSPALTNRVEAKKAFSLQPSALVFARTRSSTYQWGELLSEANDIITVDFMDGWGKCVINKTGKVLSSTGTFNVKDSMYVVEIMENRHELTSPAYQLSQGVISRLAYSVNNKPYTYAGYSQFDQATSCLNVYPVAYKRTKYCRIRLTQNKWSINYSQLPEFVVGSDVTAVYYYTDKRRIFQQSY